MIETRKGLDDSDRIFLTVALWISFIPLLVTALALPMLPDMVTAVYNPAVEAEYYSKYNDLFIILYSLIPIAILIIVSMLKRHGKVTRRFPSLILFCAMLSLCVSGITIFGVCKQFASVGTVRGIDINSIAALVISAMFSMICAASPTGINSPAFRANAHKRTERAERFFEAGDRLWAIGAYGFLLAGAGSAFLINGFAYIPAGAFFVFYAILLIAVSAKGRPPASPEPVEQNDLPESEER